MRRQTGNTASLVPLTPSMCCVVINCIQGRAATQVIKKPQDNTPISLSVLPFVPFSFKHNRPIDGAIEIITAASRTPLLLAQT